MTLKDLETQYASVTAASSAVFIRSIHVAKNDPGVTTLDLISFLDRIIGEFLSEGRRICREAPAVSAQDKDALTLQGKIVAAAIIVSHDSHTVMEMREKTLVFLEYASAVVKANYDFVGAAARVVSFPITTTGLDWKTVEDAPSLDIISYKLIRSIRFDQSRPIPFQYAGKGKVVCNKGIVTVYSAEVGEAGAKAFSLFGGVLGAVTRNSRDEKLKVSDQDDAEAVGEFAESFIKAQEAFVRGKTTKREYSPGDVVDIMIKTDEAGECYGVVVDLDNPVQGAIIEEELIKGTWTGDILPYLCEDDVICGAELQVGEDGTMCFSIAKTYGRYAREMARRDERSFAVFEAKVVRVRDDIGRINWMTPHGYGGISPMIEGKKLAPGDIVVMTINNIQTRNGATYINVCVPKYGYDAVNDRFDNEDNVLVEFVTTRDQLKDTRKTAAEVALTGDADMVRTLASIVANRAACEEPMDACKALYAAAFLGTAVDDAETVRSVLAEAFFLRKKIAFAQGTAIPAGEPFPIGGEKAALLDILARSAHLDAGIVGRVAALEEGSLPRKVGDLLLGLWVSAEYCDQVKAEAEEVRRKICELIGVSSQYRGVSAVKGGKYGKVENHEVEFKSSYVFRNDGKGADIDVQGRDEVFRTVCGFLNADGGTLYLGVNDAGDPIRSDDYGINADMRWFRDNFQTVLALRSRQPGRSVVKADTLDHYMQFLNGEKAGFFKESLLANIKIEVTPDEDAIKISVMPAEYEIAYLFRDKESGEGTAYMRDGGRTLEMTPVQKERRMARLKKVSKEMGFIVTIQEAIDQHRKLTFKDYASGNSGKVEDRFVVPVNFFYNDENVYCYDLRERKYKQFRLKRISAIETEFENPYYPLPQMAPKKADVFRWLDEGESYHIKLRMEVGAKNYLIEEYSCAEKLPPEELYREGRDKWILDTRVYGLCAVRRFYLGLADKIEILPTEDSDALLEDISRFVEGNLGFEE